MTIAHIENLELGLSVRTKLNTLIDQSNTVGNGGISQLTGDVAAGPGSGSQAATLASVITAGGPIGTPTTVPTISWDAKGRLLAVSSTAIAFPSSGITQLTGDVTAGPGGGSQAATLASILTAGGPIGSPTTVPVISWDAKGRVTAVSSATISGGGGGGASIGGAVTGGTSGSVLFIDASTNLAQDNANFFWDATLKDLHIGGDYFISTARAIYLVPNGSGNNWFEGAAGNAAVSGYANFGTGDAALASLTNGFQNVALGTQAMNKCQSASYSIAVGSGALHENVADQFNTAFGLNSLYYLGRAGAGGGANTNNIGVGFGCASNMEIGYDNTIIGGQGLTNVVPPTTGIGNTIIGANAANSMGTGGGASIQNNTFIGHDCGKLITTGSFNTWIGSSFLGPSAALNGTVLLTNAGNAVLDYSVTLAFRWSISTGASNPASLHIYNMQTAPTNTTNHERAILDWLNTSNVFRVATEAGGSGVKRLIAIDGFAKAGVPAAGDLPAGSFALIDDTTNNQTWLVFNKAGTIRKVQLV